MNKYENNLVTIKAPKMVEIRGLAFKIVESSRGIVVLPCTETAEKKILPFPKGTEDKRKEYVLSEKDVKKKLQRAFNALYALPEDERNALLADPDMKDQFDRLQKNVLAAQANKEKQLPIPPIGYQPYQPRTDALEHLKKWFGNYLTYFGAEEDLLFQQDLRRLDEDLMIALDSQIRYRHKTGEMTVKVRDVIKPLTEKIKRELKSYSKQEITESGRLYQAAQKYHRNNLSQG